MSAVYCDASASEVHEEDRELIEKLAKIQHMYQEVYQIRKLLPEKLIAPIKQATAATAATQVISPAALAAQLKKVAVEGCSQIEGFKQEWHSDEMRALWEQANTGSFPQGDDCWRTNYGRLVKESLVSKESALEKAVELEELRKAAGEDSKEVIRIVREKYRTLTVMVEDEASGLPIDVKVGGMSFRIGKEESKVGGYYSVTEKPGTKLSSSNLEILRFVQKRSNKQSLTDLMNLLASYSDVKTRPCDKCLRVFDSNLQLAYVKILRKPDADTEAGPEWSSLHQKCALSENSMPSIRLL